MKALILGFTFLTIGVGCQACDRRHRAVGGGDATGELHTAAFPSVALHSVQVADSTLLKSPIALSAGEGLVAVSDVATDSLLLMFDALTRQFVGEIGPQHVNGGFVNPTMIAAPLTATDGFKIFDPIRSFIVTVGVGKSSSLRRVAKIADQNSIIQPLYLPNGTFFSTALRIPGRFGIFAANGALIASRGPPPPGSDTVAIFVRQHANSARGAMNPNNEQLAFASRYSDKLEVYDTLGHLTAAGTRPFGFDPIYEVGERAGAPALAMLPKSRIGYIDISADSTNIYALFSGRTIGAHGSRSYYGTEVHQFGWDGKLERVLTLDREVSAITVTAAGHVLYALTLKPKVALLEYRIPSSKTTHTQDIRVRTETTHHD